MGTELIRLAGGENVFADLDDVFGDVSWEQVVERRPEVIAVYDYAGAGSVEEKKTVLLAQPALKDVPATRNKRSAVLPLTATLVGVRSADAVGDVARGLHPESFRWAAPAPWPDPGRAPRRAACASPRSCWSSPSCSWRPPRRGWRSGRCGCRPGRCGASSPTRGAWSGPSPDGRGRARRSCWTSGRPGCCSAR